MVFLFSAANGKASLCGDLQDKYRLRLARTLVKQRNERSSATGIDNNIEFYVYS
jgi:hypothetical protein